MRRVCGTAIVMAVSLGLCLFFVHACEAHPARPYISGLTSDGKYLEIGGLRIAEGEDKGSNFTLIVLVDPPYRPVAMMWHKDDSVVVLEPSSTCKKGETEIERWDKDGSSEIDYVCAVQYRPADKK